MSPKICRVGPVKFDSAGPPGYAFQIFDTGTRRPRPVLTVVYSERFQAENAKFVFEQMLLDAIDLRLDEIA
jgi:hypothetical protein